MIFRNGRLIFPDGIRDDLEITVFDGTIAEIRERTESREEIVDLAGNYLAPGFIDLHVHGALGRDTMEASVEALRIICDYHASGGTTSLLPTTVTAPINKIVHVLGAIRDSDSRREPRSFRGYRSSLRQIAGIHLEGPFVSKEKRGAQKETFIRDPEPALTEPLLEFSDVIKIITLAPELPGALNFIDQLHTRKIEISGGHSNAWDDEARAAFKHGMRNVTHTFNCMSSTRRREGARVAGLLEFALSEPEIMCELIADGHHVSMTLMKMLYRAKGARGICLVTDATAGAGLKNGSHFSLGEHECVVEDGVGWLADHSARAGSAARMIDLVRTLVRAVDVPLHEAIMMATENPARVLHLEKTKGHLGRDADADLVVLSPELEVLRTFVGGEQVFAL